MISQAYLARAKARRAARKHSRIQVGYSEVLAPALDALVRFAKDGLAAEGPVRTEMRINLRDMRMIFAMPPPDATDAELEALDAQCPIMLRIWASNDDRSPIGRVHELLRSLRSAKATIAELRAGAK